jgi:GAF domain-containing protein
MNLHTVGVMPGPVKNFGIILRSEGILAALRWLNDRVPYRFTAVFAFEGDMLHNICLVDKENKATDHCDDQPITESYCIYIHRSRERFSVEDAAVDSRVVDHPKRTSYQCYYGIPLVDSNGRLRGTVCHFDQTPVHLTDDVVSILDDLGPLISQAVFDKK